MARIGRYFSPAQAPAPRQVDRPAHQPDDCPGCAVLERKARLAELRDARVAGAFRRGMDALNHRAPDMSDADRLILARSIVMMLAKSL